MEHWKYGETQDVHKLLQAAHIPLSHRTHVFLSKEEVLYIRDLAWIRATALELMDLGVPSASSLNWCFESGARSVGCCLLR